MKKKIWRFLFWPHTPHGGVKGTFCTLRLVCNKDLQIYLLPLQSNPSNYIFEGLLASVFYKLKIYRCFCLLLVNRSLDRSQIIWLSRINLLTLRYNRNFLNRMNHFREHSLRLLVSLKKPRQREIWDGLNFLFYHSDLLLLNNKLLFWNNIPFKIYRKHLRNLFYFLIVLFLVNITWKILQIKRACTLKLSPLMITNPSAVSTCYRLNEWNNLINYQFLFFKIVIN